MVKSKGFTLVELLVVIGVVALLIGILIPVVQKAWIKARETVCASNLRQLVTASTIYLMDHGAYPAPPRLPFTGEIYPNFIPARLLNDLSKALTYPELPPTAGLSDLPAVAKCPFAADFEIAQVRGPVALPGETLFVTGYQYTGRLDDPPPAGGVVLRPSRVPRRKIGLTRGVLWSDVLSWYSGSGLFLMPPAVPPSWAFFHAGGVTYNGVGLDTTTGLRGQHSAWTDGSVEWRSAGLIDLRLERREERASYRVGPPSGPPASYFWF